MDTVPFESLDAFGLDAPINTVASPQSVEPSRSLGASRYRHTFEGGRHLDALLVNKGTDTLIVTFHGALNRSNFKLPRFERISTTKEFGHSMLFFGDPGLWADDAMELSWFTGWDGVDLQPILADWSLKMARAVGAKKIVFTGSSGGGFAALHVSALVPGSLCLAFNPQTSIYGYLAGGNSYGAQRKFMAVHYPYLAPNGVLSYEFERDWTLEVGDQLSALRRYQRPTDNYVLYADNVNDFHHHQHLLPLSKAFGAGGNTEQLRLFPYDGANGHTPPTPDQFREGLHKALAWSQTLPESVR